MKMNRQVVQPKKFTHEGAPAKNVNAYSELRRTLLACLLWEDSFYESGEQVADRIVRLVNEIPNSKQVADLAIEARSQHNLRHAPLLLVRAMVASERHRPFSGDTLGAVIQRPDEIAEFMAMYWKDGKTPIAKQVKKGLAQAFGKFNEYSLAKYNQDNAIKLKDVAFLVHPSPSVVLKDNEPVYLETKTVAPLNRKGYKRGAVDRHKGSLLDKLINGQLATPDTWEVALTEAHTPEAKKKVWNRLLAENKLGALALLRNLRNMLKVGVETSRIKAALASSRTERVLPFRFITAARYAPMLEDVLEQMMLKNLETSDKLKGKTILGIDVSGSMSSTVSGKSELSRYDAAIALAILLREICEDVEIFTFNSQVKACKPRRGFALRDEASFDGGETNIGEALRYANGRGYDRLIMFTDEQSHDRVGAPLKSSKAYMINVATYENGVGYGDWIHIDGFSESIVKYIQALEKSEAK